jgi:hypothetical protein
MLVLVDRQRARAAPDAALQQVRAELARPIIDAAAREQAHERERQQRPRMSMFA